ncbi:MAG: HD-GYP domain-containing protein [Clostridia bacterium]|nr:HD-GYP domain-containing protein [Clostridia bacterium]
MDGKADSRKPGRQKILYAVLLALSLGSLAGTALMGRSREVILIFDEAVPVAFLTGIVSTVGNLCAILMVNTIKKTGFLTAVTLLAVQLVILLFGLLAERRSSALPGLFSVVLVIIAVIMVYSREKRLDRYQTAELDAVKARQKATELLFEQTATALVNAIDAKDVYSRGHSLRVAEYASRIAGQMGKSEEECRQIYYAGLLHDVGKIGIKNAILTKAGKLNSEEYEVIKQHALIGRQILSGITAYPYLSIAANFHHERYDGRGYPEKLKGEDIPEIARIIAVADAYDAMSSNRSYRSAMPQQLVREEIVKGAGTQFDPEVARAMQHLIDVDEEYEMKERQEVRELAGKDELVCTELRNEVSEGILITFCVTRIRVRSVPEAMPEGAEESGAGIPTLILFDSLDGRYHDEPKTIRDLNYFEYAEIRFDGESSITGARNIMTEVEPSPSGAAEGPGKTGEKSYCLEMARLKDHVLITIDDGETLLRVTVAMPDSTRYAYAALTGAYCHLKNVSIDITLDRIREGDIQRIAPEISYVNGPAGDLPNVQIDGFRSAATQGVPITDGLRLRFHTMSLPTARLIWHCPFISVYSSENGKIKGPGFHEFALVRLDGENWDDRDDGIVNELTVDRKDYFIGWDAWKEKNKAGFDCTVTFERKGSGVTVTTENFGIFIRNTTYIDGGRKLFTAITGDQCALTDIRIRTA